MDPREELALRRELQSAMDAGNTRRELEIRRQFSAVSDGGRTAVPRREEPIQLSDITAPLSSGLLLGFPDELRSFGAGLGARLAGAPPERIEAAQERELGQARGELEAARERSPWISGGLELGGALATGGPLLRGAMGLGRLAGLGPGASMVAGGTAEGALAGAGAADEDRAGGALLGGLFGLGTAGLLPALTYGARAGGEAVGNLIRRFTEEPTTTAGRVLTEKMTGAGLTPQILRSRQRQMGPQATMADIAGPTGTEIGQGMLQAERTGIPRANLEAMLRRRAAGGPERLRTAVAEATGETRRLDPSLEGIRRVQQAVAEPLYEQAYQQSIPLTSKLKNILQRPPMRRAFEQAKEAAATRGEELPPFFRLDEYGNWQEAGVAPDMAAWDRMKQGIDRLIDAEVDPVTGRMTPKGRDLTSLKNEMLTELDEINPTYAQARRAFAGGEALQNAMREGERFLTMKTRDVKRAVSDMTDSERQGFLTGAVEAMRERIGRAKAGEIGTFKFMENDNVREKLRDIFPKGRGGTRQLAQLLRDIRRERTFAETGTALVGGSQTAGRQAAGRAAESGVSIPTTTEMFTSPIRGGIQGLLGRLSRDAGQLSGEAITEISNLMFQPGNVEQVIAEMQRRGIPQETINQFVNRFSRGTAALSPAAGLLGGELTNQ